MRHYDHSAFSILHSALCIALAASAADATLYHFGVITSNVHNAWMRSICGRLKSDYRYSGAIVYNNFPWPECRSADGSSAYSKAVEGNGCITTPGRTDNGQNAAGGPPALRQIAATAQAILDARAAHPDCSLKILYDELTMPPDLRKAHQENDRAVMAAYGFSTKMTESECVAELFKRYQELVNTKGKGQ